MTGVKPATGTERLINQEPSYSVTENAENLTYTYNSNGELASIATDSTTYHFTYDSFGNSGEVKVGNSSLATYEYNQNNGKLIKVSYGNGFSEEYIYNDLEMLSEVWYNYSDGSRECAVKYIYTTDGSLSRVDDCLSGISTVYVYDTAGRVSEIGEYKTADMSYYKDKTFAYDSESRLSSTYTTLDYLVGQDSSLSTMSEGFGYTIDGKISSGYLNLGSRLNMSYAYDNFDRVTKVVYSSQVSTGFKNVIVYGYRTSPHSENYFSGTVSTYTSSIGSGNVTDDTVYVYSYDERGNVIGIKVNDSIITYEYDDLGQLVREINSLLKMTCVYTYDDAGNILTKEIEYSTDDSSEPVSTTITYTYGNNNWGDQLTVFDGEPIIYDSIGNPLEYYNGFEFGWSGRNLTAAEKDSNLYTFVYNSDGLRTKKTVNNVVHNYYYNGTQLLAEEWANNLIVFLYNSAGTILGMRYRSSSYAEDAWDTYWYERNLQGDITAVYSETGTKLVSYTYDAWGDHVVTYHNGGNSILAITSNPIRYRGYYYDTDLGLYYLQTRYYDSNIGRFINADGYISTGTGILGYNMYAYCNNNPVMYVDPSGNIVVALSYEALKLFAVAILFVVTMFAIDTTQTSDAPKSITKSHSESKVESKTEAEEETVTTTPPTDEQAYFTSDPYDFNPKNLIRKEYPGSYNGKIIKWIEPMTGTVVFEWDEDFEHGAHYHILKNNDHSGDHIQPGTPVPEPWNSFYFGVAK